VEAVSGLRCGRKLNQESTMTTKEELIAKIKAPDTNWADRALAVAALQELMQADQGVAGVGRGKWGWGVRDTAGLLGLSKTFVQTDLQIAKVLRDRPELATQRRRKVWEIVRAGGQERPQPRPTKREPRMCDNGLTSEEWGTWKNVLNTQGMTPEKVAAYGTILEDQGGDMMKKLGEWLRSIGEMWEVFLPKEGRK
jgi:hypothetical protein